MATKTTGSDYEFQESNKISHCLTTFSHVVANILPYLNAKDLNRSARVCSLWSSVAKKLTKRRRTRAWTCIRYDTSGEESVLLEQTKEFFRNLYTEPSVVFLFYQSPCYDMSNTSELYKAELPPDCKFVGVACAGIIGTSSDLKEMLELEDGIGVSILCLPKYDGVDLVCAEVDEDQLEERMSSRDIMDMLPMDSPGQCKAVLTFCSEPALSRQLGFDLMKQYTNSLIAGGYVDNIIQSHSDQYSVATCAALCGSRVQVASVILKETVNTPSKAEGVIKKLKGHNLSEANSFAFMFVCIGRGSGFYGECEIESSIFKKLFPNTPLFGFFGNGEIGFDFISQKEVTVDLSEKKKKKSPPKLYHAYTTILMLVSIT